MNVKLASQFVFSDAAPLTGVIITTAGVAALLGPIWAIIRLMTALPIGVIGTSNMLRLPFTKACLRTKAGFATFLSDNFLAALFTKHRRQFDYTKIVLGISGSTTLARAILPRPTAMIPKFLAAPWADCPSAGCLRLALTRTVNFAFWIRRFVIPELFATLRADTFDTGAGGRPLALTRTMNLDAACLLI